MKTLMTTTLAAVLATGATAALAGNVVPAPADPYVAAPAPAPVAVNDWTGVYFGALGGWSTGDRPAVPDDFDGLLYGAFGGYNYQFGNASLNLDSPSLVVRVSSNETSDRVLIS